MRLTTACNMVVAATMTTVVGPPIAAQTARELLTARVEEGRATIWYLDHSGWAVKTGSHLLIFDYVAGQANHSGRSLDHGFIDPAEIADQNVVVFVTHQHSDHYDPGILRWEDEVEHITYVFGWEAPACNKHVCLADLRGTRTLGGMEIVTVNHEFDRIPEVAFLVMLDGLAIYHSGDHGTVADEPNPTFKDNIDYLASLNKSIDIAFISTFGRIGGGAINNGDRYTIEVLRPRVTFPMHHGDNEDLYERFAREISKENVKTSVYYATRPGDSFSYVNGRIEKD